jgi:hypothetical protein
MVRSLLRKSDHAGTAEEAVDIMAGLRLRGLLAAGFCLHLNLTWCASTLGITEYVGCAGPLHLSRTASLLLAIVKLCCCDISADADAGGICVRLFCFDVVCVLLCVEQV